MRRRLASVAAALSFLVLLALVIWQGSFRIEYSPSDLSETVVLWAVSTVIFLLTVTLAFMLFRALVKVYIDRQRNREGSRLRSKLLAGALVLTLAPTLFYVVFSVFVLNRHLDAWFSRPAQNIQADLKAFEKAYRSEAQERVGAETNWIGLLPETREAAKTGKVASEFFTTLCREHGIRRLSIVGKTGVPLVVCDSREATLAPLLSASARIGDTRAGDIGLVSVLSAMTDDRAVRDLAAKQETIRRYAETETSRRRIYQDTYFRLICLITVFVLFFAVWTAQILSRQISIPIAALLGAAGEIRRGNLSYRIRVDAMDELASLVRGFNEMTSELEGNAHELERRRRFIEAILESIPTGVISLSGHEHIEHVNRALNGIFPGEVDKARVLSDLFGPEDLAEIRYLLKRARRTGAAGCQLELQQDARVLHLAVTVAALEEKRGFVLVLEDTSELLRGQKAAAWQEVARRIAHEIKNPLTPISLCADRMARQLVRLRLEPETRAILEECTQTIQREVQSVKSLVDEFSNFSRFPSAQPTACQLNEVVESAMAVFAGRLEGVALTFELDPSLPAVLADKEQMKRVIVNLVDNAAEAMNNMPVRRLRIATAQVSPEVVEVSVTDTGCGVSAEEKEKLFLPYFSTKARGTGLGLAIVSRIIAEHHGRIRVEDSHPSGTRFAVELNVAAPLLDGIAPEQLVLDVKG